MVVLGINSGNDSPEAVALFASSLPAFGGKATKHDFEWKHNIDLAGVEVTMARALVAQPNTRPLYFLVKTDAVPHAQAMFKTRWGISNFRAFLTGGLSQALGPFFASIEVVDDAAKIPGDAIVAEVLVSALGVREKVVGNVAIRPIEMDWSFAIRPVENAEYTFSFSGTATSGGVFRDAEEGMQLMAKSALTTLLASMGDKDVFAALAVPAKADSALSERI